MERNKKFTKTKNKPRKVSEPTRPTDPFDLGWPAFFRFEFRPIHEELNRAITSILKLTLPSTKSAKETPRLITTHGGARPRVSTSSVACFSFFGEFTKRQPTPAPRLCTLSSQELNPTSFTVIGSPATARRASEVLETRDLYQRNWPSSDPFKLRGRHKSCYIPVNFGEIWT